MSEGDFEMRLEREGRRGKWKGFKEKMEEVRTQSRSDERPNDP